MANLFLFILGSSVSAGLIIFVLILLTPFLNKRYAAKWKYLIWIFLAARLLIPFSGAGGQLVRKMPEAQNQTVSGQKENDTDTPADTAIPYRRIVVELPAQMTAPIQTRTKHSNTGFSILDIAAYVWFIGSLILLSVHFTSYFYYRHQLRNKGRSTENVSVLSQTEKLKRELNIRNIVRVIEYSEAESPMIIGFLKPVLVLPNEHYSPEELFFILKHELVHLKRGDVYLKLLFVTANAVHWFNPLIWIMQKEATIDMELSCDERVTKDTGFAARKAYTETLLSMLHKQCARKTAFTTQFYGGKKIMKKRFKNILMKEGKRNGIGVFICAVILTISFGTLIGCSAAIQDTGTEHTANNRIQNASDRPKEETAQAEQAPDADSSAGDDTPKNTTMLTFSKEGETEQKQATLAVGDGYSIYLPDNEWKQSDSSTWTAVFNEQVQLWVTHYKDSSIDSVSRNLEEYGYTAEEGYQDGDLVYHASLKGSEHDVWVIFYSYPAELEEGWGRELPVIADTFALSAAADDIKSGSPDTANEYLSDEDCQEIRTIVDNFAAAYFNGNIDVMQKFLANTYTGEIDRYEGTGSISDLTVKGLSDTDDKKAENGTYVVFLEFRDSDYEDMFLYLTFGLVKQENNWKIQSYGVEA